MFFLGTFISATVWLVGITYSCCAVPCCPQHLSQRGLIEGQAAQRADGKVVGHPIAEAEAPREQRGAGW